MKLYYAPGACSLAPHIVLREAGLGFTLEKVDLGAKRTETGADFTRINPMGYVPALALDNGEILTEAAAILQYIADRKPEAGLLPAPGSSERHRALEWLVFVATELHKGFGPLWNAATPDAYKAIVHQILAKRFALLDRALAERQYLAGDGFTIVDAYAFTVVSWADLLKVDLAPYASLRAYLSRIAARPHVQAALRAEGLAGNAKSA